MGGSGGARSRKLAGRNRGSSGASLLADADWWVDAATYTGSGNLLDLSGNGLHAVPGAGANAPLFLGHTGTDYVYVVGAAGNAPSTPDSAALDLAGDMTITMRVDPTDWTPAALSTFVSKWTSGADASWALQLSVAGLASFVRYDGTANRTYGSTVAVPGTEGTPLWLRAVFDLTDGSVSSVVFYTSTDQVATPAEVTTWTQLGARVTNASVTPTQVGSAPVQIGAYGTGGATSPLDGKIYYLEIRNDVGALVADFNPRQIDSPYASVVGGAGETWTINRPASGRKTAVVDRPLFLFGTDDYMEVADNPLLDFGTSQNFTVVIATRIHAIGANQTLLDKRGGALNGWDLSVRTVPAVRALIGDGAAVSASTATVPSFGARSFYYAYRSGNTLGVGYNAVAPTTTDVTGFDDLSTTTPLRIGFDASGYADQEFLAAAIFRRALTTAEIASVGADLS